MSLRDALMLPANQTAKIETHLPTGLPSISALMAKGAQMIPQVGQTNTFTLPKLTNIIASVEEYIPHPPHMSVADVVQKIESPVLTKVEEIVVGKSAPAAAPAPIGIIPLSFE